MQTTSFAIENCETKSLLKGIRDPLPGDAILWMHQQTTPILNAIKEIAQIQFLHGWMTLLSSKCTLHQDCQLHLMTCRENNGTESRLFFRRFVQMIEMAIYGDKSSTSIYSEGFQFSDK
ncbi:hypothetical protein HNY73_013312 [Argiope bruennichi]|uniref:Uncharacterized protein n=1 Tax=Argiope bruennichi TaxID=94029 RepID=A0A8T0EZJ7_ARGBR|nr:hypothetical protein HNY73_013312 [Argiope bruennichi]